jgi:hypothetical protein
MEQVLVHNGNMRETKQIEQKNVLENIQRSIAFGAVATRRTSTVSDTPGSSVRSRLAIPSVMEAPQRFG